MSSRISTPQLMASQPASRTWPLRPLASLHRLLASRPLSSHPLLLASRPLSSHSLLMASQPLSSAPHGLTAALIRPYLIPSAHSTASRPPLAYSFAAAHKEDTLIPGAPRVIKYEIKCCSEGSCLAWPTPHSLHLHRLNNSSTSTPLVTLTKRAAYMAKLRVVTA